MKSHLREVRGGDFIPFGKATLFAISVHLFLCGFDLILNFFNLDVKIQISRIHNQVQQMVKIWDFTL